MSYKHYLVVAIVWLTNAWGVYAQTNPYRYGSPHYWMAQSSLDIYAGKFDLATEHLQKAEKGYRELGDVLCQIQATEALGSLKALLGEWVEADQYRCRGRFCSSQNNDRLDCSLSGRRLFDWL